MNDMTFKELLWAHLMQGQSRALLIISLIILVPGLVLVTFVFPSDRLFAMLFSYTLWSLWLTLSTPFFYALVELPHKHAKRHYAYYARASWPLLAVHQAATIVVSGIWFWGMGFFDQYASMFTFSLLGAMALMGLGITTYYHRKYFGMPLDSI